MTIRSEIMKAAKKRREKRIRFLVTDEEYTELLQLAFKENLTMSDILRKKVFGKK